MDLAFWVPMQYCSSQHWTLLLSPVTSTAGYCFCFDSIPSFFLELFLHWSPVAYWAPTDLGSSSFSILLFCLFIVFMGFSRQEYWSGLPFPSPVDHIVSDLSTMPTRLGWPHRAWLSFIELDKAVVLVWLDWLVFCDYGFSVSVLWCPLTTPTVFLGFLLPWTLGISSQLLQQSTAAAPYLGQGVSPQGRPSWPWTIECLMNYGQRFVTLYRRQGSRPFPWKRNVKKQNGSGEALQIVVKRREAKSKGEKER